MSLENKPRWISAIEHGLRAPELKSAGSAKLNEIAVDGARAARLEFAAADSEVAAAMVDGAELSTLELNANVDAGAAATLVPAPAESNVWPCAVTASELENFGANAASELIGSSLGAECVELKPKLKTGAPPDCCCDCCASYELKLKAESLNQKFVALSADCCAAAAKFGAACNSGSWLERLPNSGTSYSSPLLCTVCALFFLCARFGRNALFASGPFRTPRRAALLVGSNANGDAAAFSAVSASAAVVALNEFKLEALVVSTAELNAFASPRLNTGASVTLLGLPFAASAGSFRSAPSCAKSAASSLFVSSSLEFALAFSTPHHAR